MEYFFPSALIGTKDSYIKIDQNKPFALCDPVDTAFKPSCIYELPRLWKQSEPNFEVLSSRCLSLDNTLDQQSCYRGLGYATVDPLLPNPDYSLLLCESTPDELTELYCLSGATWMYKTIDPSNAVTKGLRLFCSKSIDELSCLRLSDLHLDQI